MSYNTAKIEAFLIGETSAGMLALEIYKNDELVYSHDYFANGASQGYYQEVIRTQAWDDMVNCADWEQYDGCDRDEDGEVVSQDCANTTLKTLCYSPVNGWSYLGSDTMSNEFIKANAHRLPADVVDESGVLNEE